MCKLEPDKIALDPEAVFNSHTPPLQQGSCALADPRAAAVVQGAFLYFLNERYYLHGWSVMPNHAHAVVTPLPRNDLSTILHSWKSYTGNELNKLLGREGPFWESESFDHAIRSVADFERFIRYIEMNPVVAGLAATPSEFAFSSAAHEPVEPEGFVPQDVRTLPFEPLASRGHLPHLYKVGATYFVTFRMYDAVIVKKD
jgi:REP element-mobilizing transposase RayT